MGPSRPAPGVGVSAQGNEPMTGTIGGQSSGLRDRANETGRSGRNGAKWLAGSVVGVIAIACLLALSPLGQSVQVNVKTTLKAPYVGKSGIFQQLTSLGCGGTPTMVKAPTLSMSTGVGLASVKSHAASCTNGGGSDTIVAAAGFGAWIAPFKAVGTAHTLVLHWAITWNTTLKATPGALGSTAGASTTLLLSGSFQDAVTGAIFYTAHNWSQGNFTSNGSLGYKHTALVSLFLNATLVSGHMYYIVSQFTVLAVCSTSDSGGSTCDAAVNVGSAGNSAKLTSIVYS